MASDDRARRRLVGVYMQHPEDMLAHAISLTLQLAAALVHVRPGRGADALGTICQDAALTRRAAAKVMRVMLRQVLSREPVTESELEALMAEIVALTQES